MRHSVCACVLAGLLAAYARGGEEKYDIRIRSAGVGEPIRVEREETRSTRTTVFDGIGRKVLDRQEKQVETFVYVETIVERPAGSKFLRRKYDKAQLKLDKSTRNLAFHDRTVVIRSAGPRYRFLYEGGQELSAFDAAPLEREFNGGDEKFRVEHLLPGKPVPVGADWVVDMGPAVRDFLRSGRFAVDQAWAHGSGHLSKTTPMGGAQFGDILYRMEIPIVAMSVNGPVRTPVVAGSKATFELSLHLCIDGSSPEAILIGTGGVKAIANVLQADGGAGQMTVSHRCDSREVRKPVPKDDRVPKNEQTGAAPMSQPGGSGADAPEASLAR
jgi:hypothetical protein